MKWPSKRRGQGKKVVKKIERQGFFATVRQYFNNKYYFRRERQTGTPKGNSIELINELTAA